jgi:hypothetical protein
MISHEYKCIFIHIPRTAGTSIEQSIKPDWRFRNFRDEKHILASTAKHLYKDYWNDYFKFSFVRNPWSRMLSMSQFGIFYGCKIKDGKIDVSKYMQKYHGIEIDPRSKSKIENIKPIKNAVYLNILNEELDFIGRFENLQDDFSKVCSIIKCENKLLYREKNKRKLKHYTEYYDKETKQLVAEKYARDIEYFGYEFEEYKNENFTIHTQQ